MNDDESFLRKILATRLTEAELQRLRKIVEPGAVLDALRPQEPEYKTYGAAWSAAELAGAPTTPSVEARLAVLENQVLTLALYCRALLQVMVDKRVITVAEFRARMDELDVADGVRDGR